MTTLGEFYAQHKETIFGLVLAVIIGILTITYATPPGSTYTPGATLDPACAPGDTNCTVEVTPWNTVGTGIMYTAGNVGIGTVAPDEPLHIKSDHGIKLERPENPRYATIRVNPEGGLEYDSTVGVTGLRHDMEIAGITALGIDASGNVGIKTETPAHDLDVVGEINASTRLCINGDCINAWPSGVVPLAGSTSSIDTETWLGNGAGTGGSSSGSVYIGYDAGNGASGAGYSEFIGIQAGKGATNAVNSFFAGYNAGKSAANANASVFIGNLAGQNATNASHAIFIGEGAGTEDTVNNTNGSSIVIGKNAGTGGFSNSIAFGAQAFNTAENQFMIGSVPTRIDSVVFNSGTGNTCAIDTSTGIACASDVRLKTNIVPLDATLDKLMRIAPVTYNWKSAPHDAPMVGFVAQNLKEEFPVVVVEHDDGMLAVNYAQMTPILTKAIQELATKVVDINDLTTDHGFGARIAAWLANASNHITRIFTGEICLTDGGGDSECINKTELRQLKQLLSK